MNPKQNQKNQYKIQKADKMMCNDNYQRYLYYHILIIISSLLPLYLLHYYNS